MYATTSGAREGGSSPLNKLCVRPLPTDSQKWWDNLMIVAFPVNGVHTYQRGRKMAPWRGVPRLRGISWGVDFQKNCGFTARSQTNTTFLPSPPAKRATSTLESLLLAQ